MDEAPSGRSSPTSTGRSSPTNDASDDPAAAISRIASLFQSLNRLRDAGYGTSVIAAKVAECRAAVVSLPPDLQAKVVALVNAIDDELEGDGAAPAVDWETQQKEVEAAFWATVNANEEKAAPNGGAEDDPDVRGED